MNIRLKAIRAIVPVAMLLLAAGCATLRQPVDKRVGDAAAEDFVHLIRALVAEGEDKKRGRRRSVGALER